ncbi:hypothetical protein [Pseudophaeobacter sp.]|uniref:hypothetical protein n=1 Tax=Pseudophaeobacter sp. TaxID=1971739 RepID=UPI00329718A6
MLDDPLMALFAQVEAEQKVREEAERREAVRLASMIGDNGGPPLAEPFGIKAAWLYFANAVELARLSVLHVRIERKKASLAGLVGERQSIMNRCIRRMRRAAGKN